MKKRIIALLFALMVCAACSISVFANADYRVLDGAGVLTEGQVASLSNKLNDISEKYTVDVIVVTVEGLGGEDVDDFARDLYNGNSYGLGSDADGVMLLFSAEVVDGGRDYYIYYNGLGYDAIDDNVEDIKDAIVGYLREDDFVNAFDTFADECEYYIDVEINGVPFNVVKSLIISLVIGFIIAFISVSVMKGKLKSVGFQRNAANYQKAGSLKITNSRDVFLYRTVSKVARPKNTTSGGGGGGSRSGGSGGKC